MNYFNNKRFPQYTYIQLGSLYVPIPSERSTNKNGEYIVAVCHVPGLASQCRIAIELIKFQLAFSCHRPHRTPHRCAHANLLVLTVVLHELQ